MKKLFLLFLLPLSSFAQVITTFQAILDGTLTYNRPGWYADAAFSYSLIEIFPSVDGLYDIVNPAANLTFTNDPYVYLYQESFDPSQPEVNLIAYDDDSGGNLLFRLNDIQLYSSIPYYVVATSYQPGATGTFDFEIVGPGSVEYQGTVSPSIPEPSMISFIIGLMSLGYLIYRKLS